MNLPANQQKRELADALRACRGAFLGVGVISGVVNLLYLSGSFFMLEIYDRVLPSRNVPTLIGLSILIGGLYVFQGLLDFVRSRILVRIGSSLDERLHGRVYEALVRLPLLSGKGRGLQPLNDLDQIRSFMSGAGPTALFDLPWMPLYLTICFLFHPLIGFVAAGGALILIVLTGMTEVMARAPTRMASELGAKRNQLAEASRRNAEVLRAMGIGPRIAAVWAETNAKYMAQQRRATDVAGGLGSVSKVLRMMLQSAVLGVGAYLVIYGQATAGIIIASAILTSRALAPVELAIANWKGFIAARQSWKRLTELLNALPEETEPMQLPKPTATLSVEFASGSPPGAQKLVVQDVNFSLKAGDGLGVIGPSASGKSSLARLLVGVWQPVRGRVRLDGAALDQWQPEALGAHIGYLPQDVELFGGSIARNIARFEEQPDPNAVIAAAKAAGVHDMILGLANGYETEIGEGGSVLSAGQRQRVALARALYGDPFLVVLDEPNSNLDSDGDEALTQALLGIRQRGGIAVIIAHRPSALAAVDNVLVMANGKPQAMGPKDEVLSKVLRRPAPMPATMPPLKVVGEAHGGAS